MAQYNVDLDELGRRIEEIVDQAVTSQDFRKLNQTITQAVDTGADAIRRVARKQPAQPPKAKPPMLYGKTGGLTAEGIGKIVGGGVLSCWSVAIMAVGGVLQMAAGIEVAPVLGLILLGGGAGLIGSGIHSLKRVSRFKVYKKTLGQKTHCTLEKLARSVGRSERFVRKELEKMIRSGLFLEGHIDEEQTSLITSDETYRHYQQSRLQLQERQRQARMEKEQQESHSPQVREVLERGDRFLEEIRRCNDAIPGQGISAKISRMELIVERIFDRVEEHPEVVPDLKKLMDYYLPMTVKLLKAYADMDAQPVQGETIQAAKKEIEDTLDTLNLAFEKLLDELFAEIALDVSSDISVLQTLLAQEGLTEDDITRRT